MAFEELRDADDSASSPSRGGRDEPSPGAAAEEGQEEQSDAAELIKEKLGDPGGDEPVDEGADESIGQEQADPAPSPGTGTPRDPGEPERQEPAAGETPEPGDEPENDPATGKETAEAPQSRTAPSETQEDTGGDTPASTERFQQLKQEATEQQLEEMQKSEREEDEPDIYDPEEEGNILH